LESAKKALVLIQKRKKRIKLADKRDAGWLAEDSEDDKKIRKAHDKAARNEKQLLETKSKYKRQRKGSSSFTMAQNKDQ
jgi:hypothetical protein